jgi:hypothetical protein
VTSIALTLCDVLTQVKQWDINKLRSFWKRWYFPANATLYVVGDFNMSVDELRAQIQRHFDPVPPGRLPAETDAAVNGNGSAPLQPWGAADAALNAPTLLAPGAAESSSNGSSALARAPAADARWSAGVALREHTGPLKRRHEVLPPVQHRFGIGQLVPSEQPTLAVYRHRLLQQFMLSIFCKLPVRPVTQMRDLR